MGVSARGALSSVGRAIEKLAIREFWMFTIAGLAVAGLVAIGVVAVLKGVAEGAGEIVAMIVTGLLLRIGDVINAIKALWSAVRGSSPLDRSEDP
jgi:hypothetical protein